uniref:Uncharacterized protein n=1 Tax=Megaviridae environmental sample TaxID=1737588 RepID=A0A5J6VI42_9VIRU|nr:MAG: hypothetical protein [Megaviridae environmental sample]
MSEPSRVPMSESSRVSQNVDQMYHNLIERELPGLSGGKIQARKECHALIDNSKFLILRLEPPEYFSSRIKIYMRNLIKINKHINNIKDLNNKYESMGYISDTMKGFFHIILWDAENMLRKTNTMLTKAKREKNYTMHGGTKAMHGKTKAMHGKTKAMHGKTKAMRGKTKAMRGKTKAMREKMDATFNTIHQNYENLASKALQGVRSMHQIIDTKERKIKTLRRELHALRREINAKGQVIKSLRQEKEALRRKNKGLFWENELVKHVRQKEMVRIAKNMLKGGYVWNRYKAKL